MRPQTAERGFRLLGNETLWDTVKRIDGLLTAEGIAYGIVGGVAVSLHGYQRNTVDLDLIVRREDQARAFSLLRKAGFERLGSTREFRSSSGVPIQFVLAGEPEGNGQEATFPVPGDTSRFVQVEGLPVLALPQLVESKLACGLGDMRRTHKDFADVVELIAIHRLDKTFARLLHKSVRKAFRDLVVLVRPD